MGSAADRTSHDHDGLFPPPERGIYCNRTLNLRAIRAIGYDMDYTLVHYNAQEWEHRAYQHLRQKWLEYGWPVGDLEFRSETVIRGLIIDQELGNLVKANRFGYVKLAAHGTRLLDFEEQRRTYARTVVDLSEPRFVFLNTLFSLSEAVMYGQLVDLLDAGSLPGALGYDELYARNRASLDECHMEGRLKGEVIADPERFVVLDPDAVHALSDQQRAGKRLIVITNSDWPYTQFMMSYAYDRFLPEGKTWRDLFELVIVSARKPDFFITDGPIYEVVSDDGLLRPSPGGIAGPGVYSGGNALIVEQYLGQEGSSILFVGDHIYGDVHVSKSIRRWRTALVLRELEDEILASESFRPEQARLEELMALKIRLEFLHARLRRDLLRVDEGAQVTGDQQPNMSAIRTRLLALDEEIGPLARQSARLLNERWGLLTRTGNDKSHLARQIERHADIYTSRVSNFFFETPFVFLRSPRGSLPHDPGATSDPWVARMAPSPEELELLRGPEPD